MQQSAPDLVGAAPPDRPGERSLAPAEWAAVHRLLSVLPGGAPQLAAQLPGARVRDLVGWVDGLPTHSVVVVDHWRGSDPVALPVRGFSVDDAGEPVGEVLVWVRGGQFLGFRHRAVRADAVPGALDPRKLDAIPWPAEELVGDTRSDMAPYV